MRVKPCRSLSSSLSRAGFSLLEMLAVVAVIALLVTLMLPALGSGSSSAQVAVTQARFRQWLLAYEDYRAAYGTYPAMGATGALRLETAADTERFVATLTGRAEDGSALAGEPLAENPRQLSFARFSAEMFDEAGRLVDGFGNPSILVAVDRDGDGWLRSEEIGAEYLTTALNGEQAVRGRVLIVSLSDQPREVVRVCQ